MPWNPQVALAVFIGLTATVEDLIHREIPNWIPALALVGGLSASVWIGGWRGLGSSLLGAAIGFGVFLAFYLLGGMGGGDVKLMAGWGAVLGSGRILEAALWTAGLGGIFAVAAVVVGQIWKRGGKHSPRHIPYAPAITLGAWIALAAHS